ncbi:MAG: asparagine synthase (glutamine-hydrolyzing) [Alphaproteobacteria bacterium]|nr:asparagine synthase (glutamine-hydrolyzing) [Alphaproteobacteria bacterium]
MCGIAGLFDTRGQRNFDPEWIRRATTALAHRGPDGDGFFAAPGVAFGHRKLAIIDLASGNQPMHAKDGSITITFNGEIFNYKELRAELGSKGHSFATASDTEAIIEGWREWGPKVVEKLRGQFAFALWDHKQETLFLARDRMGEKPMHYATLADGTFAFGSEIKAILTLPGVDLTIDPEAVADFFTYGYVPDPKTIYSSIRKLPPAHTLLFKRGGQPALRQYWNVLEAAGTEQRSTTPEELADRLKQAVRYQMVADVEVGAFLSGGVDSSSVVAMMAQIASAPVATYSITVGAENSDEAGFARTVAERYKTRHEIRDVDPRNLTQLLPKLPNIYDEPFGDDSAIPTFAVCREAARTLKVCLTGDGGDETLAGYRRYRFHLAENAIRQYLPEGLRKSVMAPLARAYPKLDWAPRPFRAKTTLLELSGDEDMAFARMVAMVSEEQRTALLSGDLKSRLAGYDPSEVVRSRFREAHAFSPLQRAQYADLMTYLPGDILVKVDRAAMANSLETRPPFLDHDFVAWAFSLDTKTKVDGGEGKAILKKGMEAHLPNALLYQPKRGFSIPVSEWLRGPLRDMTLGLTSSARLQDCGLFDMRQIDTWVDQHLRGSRDNWQVLWLLFVFDAFLSVRANARAPITLSKTQPPAKDAALAL